MYEALASMPLFESTGLNEFDGVRIKLPATINIPIKVMASPKVFFIRVKLNIRQIYVLLYLQGN